MVTAPSETLLPLQLEIRRQRERARHEPDDEHGDPRPPPEPPCDDDDKDIQGDERCPAEREVLRQRAPAPRRRARSRAGARSRASRTAASSTIVGTMSCVDRAFGDGIVPASRAPNPFQNPTHANGPFEMDPGAAYSTRHTTAATTATPTATTSTRRSPSRAVHAAATRMMIGASMLPIHDWAACHWKSWSKTRNVCTTPSAVPATSSSPSQIHSPGRQRNRSTAIWTRTPRASGSTMSSRGASVRARLSGSKKTEVAMSTTSPDFGATRASAPAARSHSR